MPKAKNITVIPATLNLHTGVPKNSNLKRRVAGYARVSTDSDEQFTSYAAQVDYYTNYIKSNPNWEFVDVYTDEGISGVMTKHRDGFNRMISDALAGRIDLIVTKSVSRFARNTVDSLTIEGKKPSFPLCTLATEYPNHRLHTTDLAATQGASAGASRLF